MLYSSRRTVLSLTSVAVNARCCWSVVRCVAGGARHHTRCCCCAAPAPPARTVVCAEAGAWLAAQSSLPCVVTSLPDVTELRNPPLSISSAAEYSLWFTATVEVLVSKLRRNCVAVFFQTDAVCGEAFIDKAALCAAGAAQAGGAPFFHKIALRAPLGALKRSTPGFTHVLCFVGPSGLDAPVSSAARGAERRWPDTFARGATAWPRGIGADAARLAAAFLRDGLGADTMLNPFCGTGITLAAANDAGMDALGVDLSPKRARHARLMQLVASGDGGALVPARSSDRVVGRGGASAERAAPAADSDALPVGSHEATGDGRTACAMPG